MRSTTDIRCNRFSAKVNQAFEKRVREKHAHPRSLDPEMACMERTCRRVITTPSLPFLASPLLSPPSHSLTLSSAGEDTWATTHEAAARVEPQLTSDRLSLSLLTTSQSWMSLNLSDERKHDSIFGGKFPASVSWADVCVRQRERLLLPPSTRLLLPRMQRMAREDA